MPTCYLRMKWIIVGRSFTPCAPIFPALIASACFKEVGRASVGRRTSDTRTRLRPYLPLSPLNASTQHTVLQRGESATMEEHVLGGGPRKEGSEARLEA